MILKIHNNFISGFIILTLVCLSSACVHKAATPKTPEPVVDIASAQEFYNLGLQYYADENYLEAKRAWLQVVRLAPNTLIASKSRDYLKKVDRILRTLKEIEQRKM